jgi:membrane associated rhomboid family serine protease
LLPYASDHVPARRPVITWALLIVNIALSLWVAAAQHWGGIGRSAGILATFGLVPAHLNPLTLLTYSFFHADLSHLLINVFFLWVFGAGVEDAVGRRRFLPLYLLGGVFGGLLQGVVTLVLLPPQVRDIPIVGASGACAALVGLFAARYYRARLSFVGLPFRPHVVAVVSVFLLLEIGTGLYALATGSPVNGIAHWAHIGGFIFGLGCARLLRLEEKGERAYLDLDARQAMAHGSPGEAIKRWERLLAREPNNAGALIELARAWLLLGDREQATRHYQQAILLLLKQSRRAEAARLYLELCAGEDSSREQASENPEENRLPLPHSLARLAFLPTAALFALGCALEEQEQFAPAAEALRAVTVRSPDAPEAETALLKVVTLYLHHLSRREEARILLRLFLERYPHSTFRAMAESLMR